MGLFKWLAVATISLASPIAMFGCQSLGTADVAPGWISIFDGETLTGWTPKISSEAYGADRRETFRANNGVLSVNYENYAGFDNDFGLFQSPVYLGGSIEYGGVWSDSSLKNAPMHVAGSLFTGIDSPLGPVILAYGQTENNFKSVYLILGTSYK